jgi:ElaB/YqjD/DUF883 family membrane-anchored ribosome-binding protein
MATAKAPKATTAPKAAARKAHTKTAKAAAAVEVETDTTLQADTDNSAGVSGLRKYIKDEEFAAKAEEFRTKAAEKAHSAAVQGKAKTGEALHGLAKLLEDSAATIDARAGESYGDYARSAAEAIDSLGEKLDAKDVDELVEDARQFVQKSPAVAIGAAAAIGFIIARMLSSGKRGD